MRMKMRIRGAAKACGFHTTRSTKVDAGVHTYRLAINLYDGNHLDD